MIRTLPHDLQQAQAEILALAKSYGLDVFETIFELVDYDEINEVAALGGFPNRYPHWRFGMEYDYLHKGYTWGLQKIYELVINNDPCYAYLQRGNMIVDQKLVMAHVYGHCDFFKNNMWFSKTNRKMLDQMANHGSKIRSYQDRYGVERVEDFIDCCLSIDNLIDPHSAFISPTQERGLLQSIGGEGPGVKKLRNARDYLDSYVNPKEFLDSEQDKLSDDSEKSKRFPAHPERDIMKFLIENAPMEPWQQELLSIMRNEAYYFAPQGQTKIMNEGWASYWHSFLMTRHILKDSEVIDFADHHSGTLATSPGQINPYKIGIELFRDIEDRWNKGKFGKEYDECDDLSEKKRWDKQLGKGREKVFEVRKLHNDVTFIDTFMNEEFCEAQKLFTYAFNRRTGMYEIVDRDWRKVKKQLLFSLTNFGNPVINIVDANFENRGELLIDHKFEGMELDYEKALDTVKSIYVFWRRPVNLLTKYNSQPKILSFDGKEAKERDA